jgi:serine/threonine protein kinase
MISESAYDLIMKLLNKNFKERLGAINIEDIKNHPFFEGINWLNIKKSKPPFVPPCDM